MNDATNTYKLEILTPDTVVFSGDVVQLSAQTFTGWLGVMAGHEPMVAACPTGEVRVEVDGAWKKFQCADFVLTTDGKVARILATKVEEEVVNE